MLTPACVVQHMGTVRTRASSATAPLSSTAPSRTTKVRRRPILAQSTVLFNAVNSAFQGVMARASHGHARSAMVKRPHTLPLMWICCIPPALLSGLSVDYPSPARHLSVVGQRQSATCLAYFGNLCAQSQPTAAAAPSGCRRAAPTSARSTTTASSATRPRPMAAPSIFRSAPSSRFPPLDPSACASAQVPKVNQTQSSLGLLFLKRGSLSAQSPSTCCLASKVMPMSEL